MAPVGGSWRHLQAPKPGTQFRVHNGRLALFHDAPDPGDYWTEYWAEGSAAAYRDSGLALALEAGEAFVDRIDRSQPVLDAGCGLGRAVGSLTLRGFDALGIEKEPEVVERARAAFPEARIEPGDVLHLDLDDASFGCYVSLGIVEHFEDGPEPALQEGRRVLRPDGLAIIEVPHLNPARERLRRELLRHGPGYPSPGHAGTFHQYYFGAAEFEALLAANGFRVLDRRHGSVQGFLFREVPWLTASWTRLPTRARAPVRWAMERLPPVVGDRWAHMMTYLAEVER